MSVSSEEGSGKKCSYNHQSCSRIGFILNPTAGGGKAAGVYQILEKQVGKCLDDENWKIFVTKAMGDGTALAFQAIEEGFHTIVSIGGDGTHNEVVNGIIEYQAIKDTELNEDIVMALIPMGTGGDLQRTLGTRDLSVEQQIDLVLHPKHYSAQPNPIDIACVEATRLSPEEGTHKRYFINTSSCGISGAVCNGANNSSKVFGGFATFLYQTCLQTLKWKNRPLKWKFGDDDKWDNGNIYQIVMANGRFYGGGMEIAPQAELDDGLFDVVIFTDVGVTDITLLHKIYKGSHVDYTKVNIQRSAVVTVDLDPSDEIDNEKNPVLIEADGEIAGTLPATWSILSGRISLLYNKEKTIKN